MATSKRLKCVRSIAVLVIISGLLTSPTLPQSAREYGLPVLKGVKGFGLDSK